MTQRITDEQYAAFVAELESKDYDPNFLSSAFPKNLADMVNASLWVDMAKRELFYSKKPGHETISKTVDRVSRNRELASAIANHGEAISVVPKRLLHAILGMITEAGEMAELLLEAISTGQPIDPKKLHLEYGDHFWYAQLGLLAMADLAGDTVMWSHDGVRRANQAKLFTRYPDAARKLGHNVEARDEAAENLAADQALQRFKQNATGMLIIEPPRGEWSTLSVPIHERQRHVEFLLANDDVVSIEFEHFTDGRTEESIKADLIAALPASNLTPEGSFLYLLQAIDGRVAVLGTDHAITEICVPYRMNLAALRQGSVN